ncbi:MAG: class I SAM-dependent methyltransferase [Chloroflexi bacterium]|nr:class I SAM-dependent methyltransferase [Chloroflexota bacterium]
MNPSSTSLHRLNGDNGLDKYRRPLWYAINRINNSWLPNQKNENLELRNFKPDMGEKNWARLDPKSSPSRAFSDLFWMQLPWEKIQSSLGEIHIMDAGCGSGRYGLKLKSYSCGRIRSYFGFDEYPHKDWKSLQQKESFIRLIQADSRSFIDNIPPKTNFFISQSAIEHFQEDLTFFKQIQDFISDHQVNTLQVHIFPSAACLKLYRLHGVRQYTPRTISKISTLFQKNSYSILFGLGGAASNALHWEYITKPLYLDQIGDWRESKSETYAAKLRQVLNEDASQAELIEPSFYALVVHSNYKERLF